MAEETENDGTWSGLVKTLIGTVGTIVAAGGAWLGSQLFGGDEQPVAQPAQPSIVINNTQQQQQATNGGKTVIIKEKAAASAQPAASQPKPKKKEGDEFKEESPKW
jgi:hypothetical protein